MCCGCNDMKSGICFKRFQKGRKERRKMGRKKRRKWHWVGTMELGWQNVNNFLKLGAGYMAVHCAIFSAFSAEISIMKSYKIPWFPSCLYFQDFIFFSLCGNDWCWKAIFLSQSVVSLLFLPVFWALCLLGLFSGELLLGEQYGIWLKFTISSN